MREATSGPIRQVEASGADLIAVLLYSGFKPTRIAGSCDEAISRGSHSSRDVVAQTIRTAGYPPGLQI
jgi:hypothetical protein